MKKNVCWVMRCHDISSVLCVLVDVGGGGDVVDLEPESG
jgi:hypothetical protein